MNGTLNLTRELLSSLFNYKNEFPTYALACLLRAKQGARGRELKILSRSGVSKEMDFSVVIVLGEQLPSTPDPGSSVSLFRDLRAPFHNDNRVLDIYSDICHLLRKSVH